MSSSVDLFLQQLQIHYRQCYGHPVICRLRRRTDEPTLYHVETSYSHKIDQHQMTWTYQPILCYQMRLWTLDTHIHRDMTEDVCQMILCHRIQSQILCILQHHPMHYQFHVIYDTTEDTFWLYVYWVLRPMVWPYTQMCWWKCWQTAFASLVHQFYPFQHNVIYTQFDTHQYPTFVPDLHQTIHPSMMALRVWQCFCYYHHEWNQLVPHCYEKLNHGTTGIFPLTSHQSSLLDTYSSSSSLPTSFTIQWRGWVCPYCPRQENYWTSWVSLLRRQLEQRFKEPISPIPFSGRLKNIQTIEMNFTTHHIQSFLEDLDSILVKYDFFHTIATGTRTSYRMAFSQVSTNQWRFQWKTTQKK